MAEIQLRNLSKRWGSFIGVQSFDLTIADREFLVLLGPSGCGKTTTMRMIAGLEEATEGDILIDGKRVNDLDPKDRDIAMVFQSYSLYPNMTVYENIRFPLKVRRIPAGEHDARVRRASRMVELDNFLHRRPAELSGGQRQRVALARAIVREPNLFLMDEPLSNLDAKLRVSTRAQIKHLSHELGVTTIYVTHDLAVVAQMADRIQVLKSGRTVEVAETGQMLNNPQQDYTKTLWSVRSIQRPRKRVSTPDPILEVDSVEASYPGTNIKVLQNVSINLQRGHTLAVVGESGSGKSTTARAITGLLMPEQGEIRFNGLALPASYKKRNKDTLRNIQMIYQMADTALNPRQRIRDIIGRPLSFYLGLKGEALKSRTEQLLRQIDLDPAIYMDRYPTELSGGQKQRVSIARALAAEPELIICDEVTSALDQVVAEGILKLLIRLQDELNLSYLFITHDLSTVRAIADDVVVMRHGHVIEQGPVDEMFTPPHHDYTDLLLSSVPQMDPQWLDQLLVQRQQASGNKLSEDKQQHKNLSFTEVTQ